MAKKHCFVIAILLCCYTAFAQQTTLDSIKSQLDAMFAGLDKTKVPTGFLWDAAVNLIEGEYYNGSALTDSNFVSLPIMGDMLQSINSASVGADTICVQAALSRIERNSSSQNVMLGILFQPYNYIVTNALTDNLINYSNGVVSDSYVNGIWQNPYGGSVLFGFAPGNDGVVDLNTSFTIANIDSLSTQTFQSIQFDPGDGNGFRSVSLGSTVMVSYLNEGIVETKLTVTVGGKTYYSHGVLQVKNPMIEPNATGDYLDTLVSAIYNGKTYQAKIVYHYSSSNKRPLIVSEGFDPWKLKEKNSTHKYSGFTDIHSIIDTFSLHSFISNYDVYYVDWYDCGADIRANAEVLKSVIRWVNENNSSGEPNIVMGQSMGGLIARYALRDMELDNEPHNTTLYISHDVPYLGANISPGLQYTYWDLRNIANELKGIFSWIPKYKDIAYEFLHIGEFTSVKQMLPLYIDREWHYNNTEYSLLQQELSSMGFPKGDVHRPIENIAIVNGGKSPSGLPSLYNSGDKLLHVFFELSSGIIPEMILFIFSLDKGNLILIPGKTTLTFQHDVYPFLDYSSLIRKTDLVFKKKLLWLLPVSFSLFSKEHYAPSSGIRYDNCSGSYYDVAQMLERDSIYHYTHSHLDSVWMGHLTRKMTYTDHLSFIPTFSAMAMPNGYNRDFYSNRPTAGVETPFTSYILQNNASEHIDFFPGISTWLTDVVSAHIDGPEIALVNDRYSVNSADPSSTVSWTISPGNEIGASNGVIVSTANPGFADIKATIEKDGGVVTKTKKVLSGMPRMTLEVSNASLGYCVHARYIDEGVESFLEEHNLKDSLSFTWYLMKNIDVFQPLSSTVDSVLVTGLDFTDYFVTIALTISYKGHSTTVTENLIVPTPYYTSVQSIGKFRDNIIYLYDAVNFPSSFFPTSTYLILRSNPYYGDSSDPFRIEVLNQEIDDPVTIVDNGVTYYFFEVFSNQAVQQFFSSLTRENSPQPLEMVLYDEDDNEIQTIQYNVTCK